MPKPRLLVFSALFPPNVIGGAELSAWNLSRWLAGHGWDVGVISVASSNEDEVADEIVEGVHMWRINTRHIYPIIKFPDQPPWKKPIWHLQDHFDYRNVNTIMEITNNFKPDFINVHYIQGLGYNVLSELSKLNIPAVFFLHDMGLACVRMSMFRNGANCEKQCGTCILSTKVKEFYLRKFARLGFCSPSQANLEAVSSFFDFGDRPRAAILNANRYPPPTLPREVRRESLNLLYVGRIHAQKGVDFILSVIEPLAQKHPITIRVAGDGPILAQLRERYEHQSWCTFLGLITPEEVSNEMNNADVLLVPSIWLENSPGVAIQALSLGLPVLGSDIGGIPELVIQGKNGELLPVSDATRWRSAIELLVTDRPRLNSWRTYAGDQAYRFDQDHIGAQIEAFMAEVGRFEPSQKPHSGRSNQP